MLPLAPWLQTVPFSLQQSIHFPMSVVPALYRGILRAGRQRWVQLQRLEALGLPDSPSHLGRTVVARGRAEAIERWTGDTGLMFDLHSSAKWSGLQLGLYGGDVVRAVRTRFDERLSPDEEAAVKGYWRRRLGPDADVDRIVASNAKQKVDDALLGLRLLNELNAFTEACLRVIETTEPSKGEARSALVMEHAFQRQVAAAAGWA